MGYIRINSVTLAAPAESPFTVDISYRETSAPDIPTSYTVAGTNIPVAVDGEIAPDFIIDGLLNGISYTVKIESDCSGAVLTEAFSTGTVHHKCADCGIYFTTAAQNLLSQISVGTLASSTCTVGSYVVDWYIMGQTAVQFTSGSSAAVDPSVTAVHPLSEPAQGGNWFPVIRWIYLDGVKYTSDPIDGESYSPDLVDCLETIAVQSFNCANGTNPISSTYSHSISYTNSIINLLLAGRSMRFDIDPGSPYFAWKFTGFDVPDVIKISYVSPTNATSTTLEHWLIGTGAPTSNVTATPKIRQYPELAKVIDLSGFTYATGDYLRIDITPNINNNTNWKFECKCLVTMPCDVCDYTTRLLDPVTPTLVWNATTCTYDLDVDRLLTCFYTNNTSTYHKYHSLTYFLGAGILDSGYIPSVSSYHLQMRKNTTGQAVQQVLFGNCVPLVGSVNIVKTGATLVYTYTNIVDYTDFKTDYNNVLTLPKYVNYSTDDTNLEHYKYFYFLVREAATCGDTAVNRQYKSHVSVPFVFNDGAKTVTITLTPGVNNYPLGTCDSTKSAIEQHRSEMVTSVSATNFSITTSVRYAVNVTLMYFTTHSSEETLKEFYGGIRLFYPDVCNLASLGYTYEANGYDVNLYTVAYRATITNTVDPPNNFKLEMTYANNGQKLSTANYIKIYEIASGTTSTTTTTTIPPAP